MCLPLLLACRNDWLTDPPRLQIPATAGRYRTGRPPQWPMTLTLPAMPLPDPMTPRYGRPATGLLPACGQPSSPACNTATACAAWPACNDYQLCTVLFSIKYHILLYYYNVLLMCVQCVYYYYYSIIMQCNDVY